jgi:hypothetical protein
MRHILHRDSYCQPPAAAFQLFKNRSHEQFSRLKPQFHLSFFTVKIRLRQLCKSLCILHYLNAHFCTILWRHAFSLGKCGIEFMLRSQIWYWLVTPCAASITLGGRSLESTRPSRDSGGWESKNRPEEEWRVSTQSVSTPGPCFI